MKKRMTKKINRSIIMILLVFYKCRMFSYEVYLLKNKNRIGGEEVRYRTLRFDIWFCLLLSFLISYLPVKALELVLPKSYESYVEEHTVADGEIGGVANDTFYRIQNVEELFSHDTFTIVSKGIEYRNRGAGYHGGYYMYAVTLPSGERVAALINQDSVQSTGDSIYSSDNILPVGKLVYEDLTKDEYFIHQIEFKEPLSRTDFYIDMLGNGGIASQEDYEETPKLVVQMVSIFVAFPIFHAIGSKLGIFPYFFVPKNKKSEWDL